MFPLENNTAAAAAAAAVVERCDATAKNASSISTVAIVPHC